MLDINLHKKVSKQKTVCKFIWILLSVLITDKGFSQKRKVLNLPNYDKQQLHFGFILGVNTFNFMVHPIPDIRTNDTVLSITPKGGNGFCLGIVSNLHLGDNFDLRFLPTLSFGEKRLIYSLKDPETNQPTEISKSVESTLLEFPVLLKFKSARANNFRAYIIGGGKPVIDLASQDKVDDKGVKLLKLKRNDLLWEIGVGFEFYTQYFKFAPELKMAYGLNNLIVRENSVFINPLEKLRAKAFYLSFTFE